MEAGTPPDATITMPALDQTGANPQNTYGGVQVAWIGEGAEKPDTTANFREVSLTPHELAASVQITDKLMRNAPAMSSQIERLMRGALISAKEFAYMSGNGVARPLGILSSGATISVARAGANGITYPDIAAMVGRLLMQGGSPYWLASQSTYSQLATISDANGNQMWQLNAIEGSPGSLMGYPVFWHERSPLLGARGDLTLVNTNPYYLVKPGSGPFVAMGYANADFLNNMTRMKVFLNVDARPWLTEPFTQEGGFQVSPFVALQ
jgi:HK97 family phage major capsid protein